MENNAAIDLIIEKIIKLDNYSLYFIEDNFRELTPAGKYAVFLFTAAATINRLKAVDVFQRKKIDTQIFLDKLNLAAVEKYNKYKAIHSAIYNTFKHRSGIIEGNLNRENRNFFEMSNSLLKDKSNFTIRLFELEIDSRRGFSKLYTNLFLFPFLDANIPLDEQDRLRNSYLEIAHNHDVLELQNFNSKVANLLNSLSDKIMEDENFAKEIIK
ncbi:MAG: hypothetical protein IR153_10125 [Flavobacterium sp.]|nr:hypothetical protein [Flavobacterium sp.]